MNGPVGLRDTRSEWDGSGRVRAIPTREERERGREREEWKREKSSANGCFHF